uniref:Uncharacterized protein n=1 Tax=Arundo donax TaxID=35708 RepID=A0A0A8ZQ42_ARUDO
MERTAADEGSECPGKGLPKCFIIIQEISIAATIPEMICPENIKSGELKCSSKL